MKQAPEYVDFILDKFEPLGVVSAKKMFGGYVLHMAGKVLGFIFDDFPVSKPRKKRSKGTGTFARSKEVSLEEKFPFTKNVKW